MNRWTVIIILLAKFNIPETEAAESPHNPYCMSCLLSFSTRVREQDDKSLQMWIMDAANLIIYHLAAHYVGKGATEGRRR